MFSISHFISSSSCSFLLKRHGEWEKKSNFDLVNRVPLLVHAPWLKASRGARTAALAELIDVFPTTAALAGLPVPPSSSIDGVDLSSVVAQPEIAGPNSAAFSQYPACAITQFNATRGGCNNVAKNKFDYMGYSVRTPDWRYTAWFKWNQTTLVAEWDGDFAEELYTHEGDDSTNMDDYENYNQASEQKQVAAEHHKMLLAFFKKH